MPTESRLHAFDALRAFALLGGIVLHAAMTFMPGLAAFGFPADSSQSPQLQLLFYVIHMFRMTLFFFVAGFFGRMLFDRKGTAGFLRDRTRRILVPMLLGWLLFGPLTMAAVYLAFAPATHAPPAIPMPSGVPLAHLWFLYYLLLIYAIVLAARSVVRFGSTRWAAVRRGVDRAIDRAVRAHIVVVALAAPLALLLASMPNWMIWAGIPTPDYGLTPQWPALLAYAIAFAFGWLTERRRDWLAVWRGGWLTYLTAAIGLTLLSLWLAQQAPNPLAVPSQVKLSYAFSYTIGAWCWVFGLAGAALRFWSGEGKIARYLADASYWMYLAHLPVVFALQLLVLRWPLHWSMKFPLIVLVATGVLLGSYHWLVRGRYAGALLSGSRRGGKTDAVPLPRSA